MDREKLSRAPSETPAPEPETHELAPRTSGVIHLQRTAGNRAVQRWAGQQSPPSSGQPLDPATQAFMESGLGSDFADVRLHTDASATRTATKLAARAYTRGRDIYFGAGQYAPQTREGQELLAHELTHTVQQSRADSDRQSTERVVPANDPSEREAESASRQVVAGGTAALAATAPAGIQLAPLTADDYEALVQQLDQAMFGFGTDEEGIFVSLQKLNKDPTAIADLKAAYKKKFSRELVDDLTHELSESELRMALELLGTSSSRPQEQVAAAAPTTAAEFDAVADRLRAAMAVWGTYEEDIYAALLPFKRDPALLLKLKTAYKAKYSTDLEADLKNEMSSDELAYALYLLKAPPPATPKTAVTVNAPGTEDHKAKVLGGEVSVHTNVEYTPVAGGSKRVGGFSISYQGGQASESRWLQFLWAEIVATQADGSEQFVNKTGLATSQTRTMDLTTDPAKPQYSVDSAVAGSPFYEAGGMNNRTATGTTIYDRPGEFTSIIKKEFDKGATKVVERDHFDTFLIRDYKTIYRVSVVVEWVYTSKTSVTRTTKFSSGDTVSSLPSAARERLIKDFPDFDYIQ